MGKMKGSFLHLQEMTPAAQKKKKNKLYTRVEGDVKVKG